MSLELGSYSFLPWLRIGLANQLQPVSEAGKTRATVNVKLRLHGENGDTSPVQEEISRDVEIYGPGDIIGIDSRVIIKNEPRNWITDFESNYLPHIDFLVEDFAWRYTPEIPDEVKHRLRPWIMLLVLKEDEFREGQGMQDKPLPFIEVVDPATAYPPFDELWAWAHVHINRDVAPLPEDIISEDMMAVLPKFEALLAENPDLAYCRLLSPRRLEANQAYHAFLIPVYETGRLAGLGLDPAHSPGVAHGAWIDYPADSEPKAEANRTPFYHRWYFRTGTVGDFEYLVRLLEAKPMDPRVGIRDFDVQEPGSNIRGIDNPDLGGVLKLGGALQIPRDSLTEEGRQELDKYDRWDQPRPHPFQHDLANFINLADDYQAKSALLANTETDYEATIPDPENPDDETATIIDPDPLITPPLYGRWHGLTRRLLTERDGSDVSPNDNWIHELNLDPRFRISAAFGTEVVQTNQETYMNAAWEQIGDVLEANRRIRLAQMATEISSRWYGRYLLPLNAINSQKAFLLTTPVQKRVRFNGKTTYFQVKNSRIPYAITSTTARQLIRPRGRLVKALPFAPENEAVTIDTLVSRINDAEVSPAPPRKTPDGADVLDKIADNLYPEPLPTRIIELFREYPWLWAVFIILALLFILLLFTGSLLSVGLIGLAALAYFGRQLRMWQREVEQAESIREENQTPESVDALPKSPDFRLSSPDDNLTPRTGLSDSPEAVRFKAVLKDVYTFLGASRKAAELPERLALPLSAVTEHVIKEIDPHFTIPRHTNHTIFLPERIRRGIGNQFVEAMAYPEIDKPMYDPLVDISAELFLPNLNFIEANSISLLETNQKFIESYMIGLNHEFARELLWREYPTDQRGSYFRQFWDVTGFLDVEGKDAETLREKLRDIPPLHCLPKTAELGKNDHRDIGINEEKNISKLCDPDSPFPPDPAENEAELVLVIRGELLKKYPTAVIYAHRAVWQEEDGEINIHAERRLMPIPADQLDNPPRDIVKTPLYEAKVDPDIYFFGFDLTAKVARGDDIEEADPDPGWFFVLKERPGEPRFGLDIGGDETISLWNDLGWENVLPGSPPGSFIEINRTFDLLPLPPDESEQSKQADEDRAVSWHPDTNAAELAYILYQVPVLVAVHAAEMLAN